MMRNFSRSFQLMFYAVIGIVTACVFTACGHQKPFTEEDSGFSVLRIATPFKIQNLNPIKSGHYFLVEFGVVELPLIYDDNHNISPWLLESYAQIDDLNWRLTLRSNVQFQNGKPLTAARLAAAMSRQLERSASTRAVLPDVRVAVTGEREVTLTTSKPDPTVPSALADESVFPIYDVEAVETAGDDADALLNCNCYTGAYRTVSLDDRELRLDANKNYWRGLPPLAGVVVRFVPDAQARILAIQNGELDIALYPPTEAKRMLVNHDDAFFVTNSTSSGGPCLIFNVRRAPFDETAIRRAFSLGINFEALAQDVMDGVFGTATGFYPPSFSWAVQNQETDIEEARRLLTEAGWLMGDAGVRVHNGKPLEVVLLVYPQQPDWKTLATAIQGQLNELGFRLRIRQVDDIYAGMRNHADWNVAIDSPGVVTTGGAPDPILSDYLRATAEQNYGGVADAELDKLIDELGRTFDMTRRAELLARIQQIVIADKAYEIRVVFTRSRAVVGRAYHNYKPSPTLHHVTYETRPSG
jgi:peptide/nickel transport system substrate-binding protein